MPINKKLMSNLKKEYGEKEGESVYYAMENKKKKRFQRPLRSKQKNSNGYNVSR